MAYYNKENVSKAEEALRLAYSDLIAFGKLFLPKDFLRSETPPFHYEVADTLLDQDLRQVGIFLPRGHGKSVLSKASVVHDFVFASPDNPLFYAWVSATQRLAVGNMDYIKYHLEYNDKLRYFFGDQKGRKWTEEDIELANGCKLISKSNISGIRGGAKLHKRYELIILDDFEDENNTITQEARAKNSNLITAVVFPALEPHTGRLRLNGTPVHYASFINELLIGYRKAAKNDEDFSWRVITYKAKDNKGNVLWPSWFPETELERKKKFYADSGQPHKYYQEYMMEVQSEEDSIFKRDHIKYWDGSYLYDENTDISYIVIDGDVKPVNIYVGCDPATDINRRDSDYTVIMAVAVDENNYIYVLDYIRQRSVPVMGIPGDGRRGITDYLFDYNGSYHPTLQVIEDTPMSRPIFAALKAEMMRRNDFSLKWLEEKPYTRQSKRERIQEVLAQRFAIGQIHIKKSMYDLQQEIITFGPRMAHDDAIDALAYAVKYASPPINLTKGKDNKVTRRLPQAKSWVIA